jgi:hypothetical protein
LGDARRVVKVSPRDFVAVAEQSNVAKSERGVGFVFGVFAGSTQEKETNDGHVCRCQNVSVGGGGVHSFDPGLDD